jgi:hypothetical protein
MQGGTVYGCNYKSLIVSGSVLSNDNLIYEEAKWQVVGRSCSNKTKVFSELNQEKYVSRARSRIIHLQTSTLQPSLSKPFEVIRIYL